ncbi:hypothetical protein CRE_04206 [Caenorhabditis remanei]|uniref:Sdz-33 F-box domain-containing protein n=1 Tax=Caenorhabditis remanei TaxID=31234 RepID=E3MYP4_CAERE|nr:hypothetical protein CRE_04206 [Caenorhabditis remanei]
MTTPFPLFSLPYLPLKQVLDNVGSEALVILSMCSLRSKNIAVSYRGPSKSVRLKLRFGSYDYLEDSTYFYLTILLMVEEKGKLPIDYNTLETVRIGSFEKIPVVMEKHSIKGVNLITYWEDRITGLVAIGDYAREVFNQDIYQVRLYDKEADDDHRRAAEWIKNSQKTIQSLRCDFKPKIDKDIDFILENFNYTEKLFLFVRPSEHYSPSRMPSFQVDSLHVRFSFWIKQDHLLTMNCKYIWLENSTLSSHDFNVLLKHWMNGGCSQLKVLRVDVEELIDYEVVVLDGVEFTQRADDVERVFVDEVDAHTLIRGGIDIKRPTDNAKLTIYNGGNHLKHFWMIVWPDSAENSY